MFSPCEIRRKFTPHLRQFIGIPNRTCQPRLARQFGQRFANWSRHNTITAPKIVPIKLCWVRLEISKNSIIPIATNTKSQKATNNPIVALWCWRNFLSSSDTIFILANTDPIIGANRPKSYTIVRCAAHTRKAGSGLAC